MVDLHKNFAGSTVATAPSPATSGTSLTVASGTGSKFPTPPFNMTVWPIGTEPTTANAEIVRVTAKSGDVFTIIRNTSFAANDPDFMGGNRSIVNGDQVAAGITNRSFTDIERPLAMSRKLGSIVLVGQSYIAGSTQADSGTSNVYQESLVSKLMAMMGIHEDNTIHLGQAGSLISGAPGPINNVFAGWRGVAQFVLPNNSAVVNAASDVPITDPVVSVNAAGVIVHGTNDFSSSFGTVVALNNQYAIQNNNAAKHAYRFIISRMRAGVLYVTQSVNGTLTWDSSIAFNGTWNSTPAVVVNSGAGLKYSADYTNGNFVITLPNNFTGGTLAIALLGGEAGATYLTSGYASSGGVTVSVAANSMFPAAGNIVVKNVNTGEEMLVTSGLGSNSWTVASGGRGVNGTSAAAGSTNDVIITAPDTYRINWTTNASAGADKTLIETTVGKTIVGGQSAGNVVAPVTQRFALTSAMAGKTITGTLNTPVSGLTSPLIYFDSYWFESADPGPVVITNLHDYEYSIFSPVATQSYIAAWNSMLSSVVSEFADGFARVADVSALWSARNGTLQTTLNNTDSSTSSVVFRANNTSFTPVVGQRFTFGKLSPEYVRVTAVSGPSGSDWTLTLARGETPGGSSGTSTSVGSGTPGTMTNSGAAWLTDQWKGHLVTSGGKTLTVASNTGTVITGTAAWGGGAPGTGAYTISAQAEHAVNDWMGPADWMHTDGLHLNVKGHAVYAETIFQSFDVMPTPSPYQVAQVAGNWSQQSQKWSLGIIDNYYRFSCNGALTTATIVDTREYFVPMYIEKMCLLVEIGISNAGGTGTTGTTRFGIYMPDYTHARPGRLLQELGSRTPAVSDSMGLTGCHQVLRPGWYWLSAVHQGATPPTLVRVAQVGGAQFPQIMSSAMLGGATILGLYKTTAGALGDATGAAFTEATTAIIPRIYVRLRTQMWQ